jgi:hypothetical protein
VLRHRKSRLSHGGRSGSNHFHCRCTIWQRITGGSNGRSGCHWTKCRHPQTPSPAHRTASVLKFSPRRLAADPPARSSASARTYCLPLCSHVIGCPMIPEGVWNCHTIFPVSLSTAMNSPVSSPVKTSPPSVTRVPAQLGPLNFPFCFALVCEHTDPPHRSRCPCSRRQRLRHSRATKKGDELPSPHINWVC